MILFGIVLSFQRRPQAGERHLHVRTIEYGPAFPGGRWGYFLWNPRAFRRQGRR